MTNPSDDFCCSAGVLTGDFGVDVGPFSGQGFETPEALISGPSNFVPKLTLFDTTESL
jgi:hypothetical protein